MSTNQQEYEGNYVLFIRGPDNIYASNYAWAHSIESYDNHMLVLDPPKEEVNTQNGDDMKVPEFVDKQLKPRRWTDAFDVKKEVQSLKVVPNRELKGVFITQRRYYFGNHCEFSHTEPTDQSKSEYKRQKFPNYGLCRKELDIGFQAASKQQSVSTQTHWARKLNKTTQYEPVSLDPASQQRILESEEMKNFLLKVEPRCKEVLQQNETLDLFKDEFKEFDEDDFIGNRAQNILNNLHTFSELTYCKNKIINGIGWQPNKYGVVAFSCSSNHSFNQWVDHSGKVMTSYIFIWNFSDLLHPQLILQVPGNLTSFQMNPENPNLIAGGLQTGQVMLWDLGEAKARLANMNRLRAINLQNKGNGNADGSVSGEKTTSIPPIKLNDISFIDKSHSRPITCLLWLPTNKEITKKGEIIHRKDSKLGLRYSNQFMTVAGDGHLMFWDIRYKLMNQYQGGHNDHDVKWTPFYTVPLSGPDNSGPVYATKISFGDGTKLVCVTEDGEVCHVDWAAKIQEEQNRVMYVSKLLPAHFSTCTAVERSPHFSDIYLTVGDWTFTIWKTDMDVPVFRSAYAADYLTCGKWSPTRPGIIITSRADGIIDVWDLLDQCHKPSLNKAVTGSSERISSMEFWQSKTMSVQYLAVGDVEGKLHVIEIPRNLKRKLHQEEQLMRNFYEREIGRVEFSTRRKDTKYKDNKTKGSSAHSKDDEKDELSAAQKELDSKEAAAAALQQATKKEMEEENRYQKMLKEFKQTLLVDDD